MENNNPEIQQSPNTNTAKKTNQLNTILRIIAILLMLVTIGSLFYYYGELRKFNEYPKDPCGLCKVLNPEVTCFNPLFDSPSNSSHQVASGNLSKALENIKLAK